MAWIEKQGKLYFVYDRIDGKKVCFPAGDDHAYAERLRDHLDRAKKRRRNAGSLLRMKKIAEGK